MAAFSNIQVRHKSINTPLSHERLVGGLQDGGRGTHVTHFVQLYPHPLYTASQVRTTCRSWDEGVLTDVYFTGVLTDLCLPRYNYNFVGISPYFSHAIYFSMMKKIFLAIEATDNFGSMKEKALNAMFSSLKFF